MRNLLNTILSAVLPRRHAPPAHTDMTVPPERYAAPKKAKQPTKRQRTNVFPRGCDTERRLARKATKRGAVHRVHPAHHGTRICIAGGGRAFGGFTP